MLMAIKLFAHMLRGAAADDHLAPGVDGRSLDLRRWMLADLVVRRADPVPWGLSRPLRGRDGTTRRRDAAAEPLWADTQPCCHEQAGSLPDSLTPRSATRRRHPAR
jgi:hypothetical protein